MNSETVKISTRGAIDRLTAIAAEAESDKPANWWHEEYLPGVLFHLQDQLSRTTARFPDNPQRAAYYAGANAVDVARRDTVATCQPIRPPNGEPQPAGIDADIVSRVTSSLPDDESSIVAYRAAGLSEAAIADVLGRSRTYVRSRLGKARDRLQFRQAARYDDSLLQSVIDAWRDATVYDWEKIVNLLSDDDTKCLTGNDLIRPINPYRLIVSAVRDCLDPPTWHEPVLQPAKRTTLLSGRFTTERPQQVNTYGLLCQAVTAAVRHVYATPDRAPSTIPPVSSDWTAEPEHVTPTGLRCLPYPLRRV